MPTKIAVNLALVDAKPPLRALADAVLAGSDGEITIRRVCGVRKVWRTSVGESASPTDNLNSEWKTCPHCGAELIRLPGAARIEKLIMEGRTFVGFRHPERKREWAN